MRNYGFYCKTPGCETFLVVGELTEDTLRSVHIPINLGDDPRTFKCPECGKAYDYYFSEHEIVRSPEDNGN
jgi:hypothetical protein